MRENVPSLRTRHALAFWWSLIIISCSLASSYGEPQRSQLSNGLLALRQLGLTLARAVLAKDVPTLLEHDRPDLRSQDEEDLKNSKSALRCFLFDSSCLHAQERSIYAKLSAQHRLAVAVVDLGKASDGTPMRW